MAGAGGGASRGQTCLPGRATKPRRPCRPRARTTGRSVHIASFSPFIDLFPTGADNSRRVPRHKVHEAVREPTRSHPFHPIRSESHKLHHIYSSSTTVLEFCPCVSPKLGPRNRMLYCPGSPESLLCQCSSHSKLQLFRPAARCVPSVCMYRAFRRQQHYAPFGDS